MRKAALSAAIVLLMSATANASSPSDAQKVCLDRYNVEKSGGSLPVGMSKSKYLSQCANSIRRAAKLEQELATQDDSGDAGSNEVTPSNSPAKPAVTTSKPPRVQTTLTLGPKGS